MHAFMAPLAGGMGGACLRGGWAEQLCIDATRGEVLKSSPDSFVWVN